MALSLARDLHVGSCDGALIFLDASKNRYFRLPPIMETCMAALLRGESEGELAGSTIAMLRTCGVVCDANAQAGRPIRLTTVTSVFEQVEGNAANPSSNLVIEALFFILIARGQLHLRPRRVLARLARSDHPERLSSSGPGMGLLPEIVAAFEKASFWISSSNRCLERALAMRHMLMRRSVRPDLVFAVTLRPFGAHCWLQLGHLVIGDTVDRVSDFRAVAIL